MKNLRGIQEPESEKLGITFKSSVSYFALFVSENFALLKLETLGIIFQITRPQGALGDHHEWTTKIWKQIREAMERWCTIML